MDKMQTDWNKLKKSKSTMHIQLHIKLQIIKNVSSNLTTKFLKIWQLLNSFRSPQTKLGVVLIVGYSKETF